MILKVLASSSSGNGYLLQSYSGQSLLIEAGVRLSTVKKALNFDVTNVQAAIVSHSHLDHGKYIKEFCQAGIRVYSSLDTFVNLKYSNHNTIPAKELTSITAGEFVFMPFKLIHDVTNYGYIITHPEMGKIVFITDTHYCPYSFKGLTNIIIEANYDKNILDRNVNSGRVHPVVQKRVTKSHMGLHQTAEFLSANDLSKVNNIVLIHLSDTSSNAVMFQKNIQQLTGKTVHIASKGMDIPFDSVPF